MYLRIHAIQCTSRLVAALIVSFSCSPPIWAATYTAPPDQVNLRIPPVGTGGSTNTSDNLTTSTIVVSGFATNQPISYLKVNLSMIHTYDGDLIITLVAPDGTPFILANRVGGSGANYMDTTFDDEAGRSITNATPPFRGYFTPVTSFSLSLTNRFPNGTWMLQINDAGAGDTGTLLNWSLDFIVNPLVDVNSGNILWSGSVGYPFPLNGWTSDTFLTPSLGLSFFVDGLNQNNPEFNPELVAVPTATGPPRRWSTQAIPASGFYPPAMAPLPDGMGGFNDYVFVTAQDGYLRMFDQQGVLRGAIDVKRGSCASDQSPIAPAVQLWTQSDVNFRKQFPDGDSLVFVGTQDGCGDTSQNRILAFRASNVSRVWTFNGDGSYNMNAVTSLTVDYARNTLYAATISAGGQQSVFALSTTGSITATLKWSFNAGTVIAKPVLGDSCLYVAGQDGVLHKLDAETGAEIWSFQTSQTNALQSGFSYRDTPAFDPIRNMLFVTDGRYLAGIKDQGDQPALIWTRYSAQHNMNCESMVAPQAFSYPVVAPELGKLYVVAYTDVVGQILQYDIASRTIEVEVWMNTVTNTGLAAEILLNSDNGGTKLNRLMAIGYSSLDGSDQENRFCIPWDPKYCAPYLNLAPSNDLAISVTSITPPLQNGEAPAGQPLTYTLAVTNRGPGDVPEATVGDLLHAGLAFVSATVSQGHYSFSGNTFAADLVRLTNGASATVTLTVLPTISGTEVHAATVAADLSYDPVPANNTVDLSFFADAILSISNSSVLEPNIGTALMVFTVSLAAPYYLPVSVNYSTSDLTAQAGLDYLSTNGTLIFDPGETNKTISVPVMSDTTISGDETFQIHLSNPTNAVLLFNQYTAVGTIIDDDGPIVLQIALAGTNVLLSWSTNIEGFTLETTYNLNLGTWNQVFAPVGVVGDQNVVTNNIWFDTQFYRLRKYNGPPQ